MKPYFNLIIEKFEGVSLREQFLIGLTVAALLIFILQLSFIDPLHAKQKVLDSQISSSNALKNGFDRQLARDDNNQNEMKLLVLKKQAEVVEDQLHALDGQIREYSSVMVPAHKMPELLQVMLGENDLQLLSLENSRPLPLIVISENSTKEEKQRLQNTQLYRHGITIKLKGDYQSILNYINDLENQEWKFNWRSMVYEVTKYPLGEIELQVQTLSRNEKWLGV